MIWSLTWWQLHPWVFTLSSSLTPRNAEQTWVDSNASNTLLPYIAEPLDSSSGALLNTDNMHLTVNDRRLISALKHNARLSISELARALGLSRTTVQKRLNQLERNKVIVGYTAKLSQAASAGSFQSYVNLVVDPSANLSVITTLEKMPEVEALYTVSGRIDFVAIIRADSPAALDQTLDKIVAITGVKDTRSAIILSTKFDRR